MRPPSFLGCTSFTPKERVGFLIQLCIAIACAPIYMSPLGALFGLCTGICLMPLIFKPRSEYLFPLMVHFFWGSQQRYLVLVGCFIYVLANFERLRQYRILKLFLFYLLILPFFLWYTWRRYVLFGGGMGSGGTFNGLAYYLAFAPFFWAVLGRLRITIETLTSFMVLGLIIPIAHILGVPHTRMIAWTADFMPIFFVWCLFQKGYKDFTFSFICAGVGTILFVVGLTGLFKFHTTFTQLGVVVVGVMYMVSGNKAPRFSKRFSPLLMFALAVFLTFYTIDSLQERGREKVTTAYNEMVVTDVQSLEEKALVKVFNDRAPLWSAAWDSICQQFKRDPVWVEPVAIIGEVNIDGRMVSIQLMAHSILLLLLQDYGWYGGLGLYLILVVLFSKKEIRDVLTDYKRFYIAPIAAACLGHALVGGYAGQYIMNVEFSFVLFSILGCVFYACYDVQKAKSVPMMHFQ